MIDYFIFYANRIKSANGKAKVTYVLLTLFTTCIRFFKGFVYMRYLTLKELGILTLITTVMGLFILLQIGLLNGGYRIFSVNNPNKWKVNDTIYSYFLVIWVIILIGILCSFIFSILNAKELIFALLGSFFGIIALFNNWNRNLLVAEGKLNQINKYQLISTLISFSFLIFVVYYNIYGALLVTFSIELIFYFITIRNNREYLPRQFTLKYKDLKWILSFGFIPFLAGIVTMVSSQVETWSIAGFISTEALGEFYLPKLYISLFLLIPVAVNRIYFPTVMKEFVNGNFGKVKQILIRFFTINIFTSAFALIISILFIERIVNLFVPNHLVGIPYIWLIIPGLVVYTLLLPIKMIFNAAVKLRPLLIASIIALIFSTFCLLFFGIFKTLILSDVSLIKSITFMIGPLFLLFSYILHKKSLWQVSILDKVDNKHNHIQPFN